MRKGCAYLLFSCLWFLPLLTQAHVGDHPSVHDTAASVLRRFARELKSDDIRSLSPERALSLLSPVERHILATEHLSFDVNVPIILSVIRDEDLKEQPFWLRDQQFKKTNIKLKVGDENFDVWQKEFPQGHVGLGVNSLTGGDYHYFVSISPKNPADTMSISNIYPGQSTLSVMVMGARPYVDRDDTIAIVPNELAGHTLLRTQYDRRDDGKIVDVLRITEHPSSNAADHILLTWSADPRITQTIQWRTSKNVKRGVVSYQKKADFNRFQPRSPKQVRAETVPLSTPNIVNDPFIHWHTVTLANLEPGTTYLYSVGDGSQSGWSELSEFTTAPSRPKPFSFIYMGDAQNGLDRWGTLLANAFRQRPDAAFYIMAGDLVNRGAERNDWDSLFHNSAGIYDRRQLVPALGNHECQGGHPSLYLKFFSLLRNGPKGVEPERAYSFEYSNALFIILDSNLPPESQTEWLEQTLSRSKAKWKFVAYHHPAYSSLPRRDNKKLRHEWTPIFDKYHVDLALQGHDHAYLRTYPMKGNKRVKSPKEGTVYIVSISGTKMYEQDPRDYTEFGMTNVSTYQVLDIQIDGDRMIYRAYDIDGKLRDEFVIEK